MHQEYFINAERIAGFGFWEIFLDENRVEASPNACRIYGIEPTQSLDISEMQSFPLPEYRPMLDKALADLIAGQKPYNVDFKIKRLSDNTVAVIHSEAEYDSGNRRVFGVIADITRRQQAEEALRASEKRYRLLAENTTDVIWTMSLDGRFTYVSPSVFQLRGYTPEEVLEQTMSEEVCPGSLDKLQQALEEALSAEVEPAFDNAYFQVEQPRKDGTTVWTEVNARLVFEDGKPSYVEGVSRDITGRWRAETELRRSEEKYRQLFNSVNDAIYFHEIGDDGRGRFIEVNDGASRLMGYSREEFLAMSPKELDDPQAMADTSTVRRDMEKEGHAVFERVHIAKDGRRVPVEISSQSVSLEGREMYLSVVRDITERRDMEARLEQAAAQWRATFDAITTPISIQDRDYRIIQVNRAFAEAMNAPPEALIGRTCFEVSHGTSEPVPTCPHRRTLESGEPEQVEVHNAETGTYTRVSTYPMFGPDGEIIASVHITQDITEQRKMQEQLMVTNRLASVGELAAGIAHEINNPLTGILGFSELMLENHLPENLRPDVETIHSEAKRAAGIIRNLLVFARRHAQVRETLDVNEVVERVLSIRAYDTKLNNIDVVKHLDPALPQIIGDHFQLQQVFLNIVINAEYFMLKAHNRGTLTVTTGFDRETQRIRISFADDGPGVPPEIQSRLFDPFFTTKDVGQGTGLGLSISHGVIKQHNGTIRVESQPGTGACFIIELPLESPLPEAAN